MGYRGSFSSREETCCRRVQRSLYCGCPSVLPPLLVLSHSRWQQSSNETLDASTLLCRRPLPAHQPMKISAHTQSRRQGHFPVFRLSREVTGPSCSNLSFSLVVHVHPVVFLLSHQRFPRSSATLCSSAPAPSTSSSLISISFWSPTALMIENWVYPSALSVSIICTALRYPLLVTTVRNPEPSCLPSPASAGPSEQSSASSTRPMPTTFTAAIRL